MSNTIFEKGKKYRIKSGTYKNSEYVLEDSCMNVLGRSWADHKGNPACIQYIVRAMQDHLPIDDNVYYGKIGMFGHLVHESEIGEEIINDPTERTEDDSY